MLSSPGNFCLDNDMGRSLDRRCSSGWAVHHANHGGAGCVHDFVLTLGCKGTRAASDEVPQTTQFAGTTSQD